MFNESFPWNGIQKNHLQDQTVVLYKSRYDIHSKEIKNTLLDPRFVYDEGPWCFFLHVVMFTLYKTYIKLYKTKNTTFFLHQIKANGFLKNKKRYIWCKPPKYSLAIIYLIYLIIVRTKITYCHKFIF